MSFSAAPVKGKFARVDRCRGSGKTLPILSTAMRVARALWPHKTDVELAARTGASERLCRYWLEQRFSLSADHLAALLRSEDGLKFLEALMGDARPVWWRAFERQVRIADLRRRQEEQRIALESLEREAGA